MTHLFRVLIFGCCLLAACANSAQVFEAIERGDTANVEALLAKGVDVNAKDVIGWTPLHRAAYGGKKDVVELLLAKGAEVNAKGGDVNDEFGNGGITPLHLAVLMKRKDVVELLLAKGAEVNAKDGSYFGKTPLQTAAYWGEKDIVELLLAKGADVNVKDTFGETPRDLAKRKGKTAVVELLNEQFRLQDEQRVEKARLLEEHRLEQEREQTKLLEGRITSNPRAGFLELIARLKNKPSDDTIRRRIIKLADELNPAPAIPEDARKHFIEGTAIVKAAKNPAQQTLAAQSFAEALNLAPWWGDAYYNLGVAQDKAGNYKAALRSLKLALLTSPDSKEMKALIYEVEYRDEKENSPEAQAAREKEAEQRFVASLEGAKYVCREIRDVDGGRRRVEIDIINGQITTANVTTWLGSEPSKNDYVGFRGSWSPNIPIRGKVNQVVTKQDDLRVEIYEDRLVFKRVYVGMAFGDTCPRIN